VLIIGLTGSIAMGKSTTTAMFRQCGVPVHDADATVGRLYSGEAIADVEAAFPGVTSNGAIDRQLLAARVLDDPEALRRLEAIVHPLVRKEEAAFLARCAGETRRVVVLDIPLLFETGGEDRVDVVAVVSADAATQRARVLARPGMSEAKLDALLARQMPDVEKRRRAHFVVETGRGFAAAAREVDAVLRALAFAC
jgi:dephospho-CoA kinase